MYFAVHNEKPIGSTRGNSEFTAYVLRVVLIPSVIKKHRGITENTAFDSGGMRGFMCRMT